MFRKLGLATALLSLLVALNVQAVGLGEGNVVSFLNQPLRVEIPLLDTDAATLESVSVRLGSAADYDRIGLALPAFSAPFTVTIDRQSSPPRIQVRSQAAIRDPVVQMLLDVSWDGGRILKEFTFFLDPATIPVRPPQQEAAEPSAQASNQSSISTASSGSSTTTPSTRSVAEYGPVGGGETLWRITNEWLGPNSEYTVNQAMLAIVRANPQAFTDGDVNRLRRGSILRMPDDQEISRLSASQASAEVSEQTQRWRRRQPTSAPQLSSAAAAPSRSQPTQSIATDSATPQPAGRLELVAPSGDDDGGSGQADAEADRIAQLQERLENAEDQLAQSEDQNAELLEEVSQLRELLGLDPDTSVAIEDADLASLANRLREDRLAEDASDAAAASGSPAVDGDATDEDNAATSTESQATQPASQAANRPEPEPWWKTYFWWIVGAAILLLLLLLILRSRSRGVEYVAAGSGSVADSLISAHEFDQPEDEQEDRLDDNASGAPDEDLDSLTEDAEEILRLLETEKEEPLDEFLDHPDEELPSTTEFDDGTSVTTSPYDEDVVKDFMGAGETIEPTGDAEDLPEPEGDSEVIGIDSDDDATESEAEESTEEEEYVSIPGEDQVEVKLDLARAYIAMDDPEAARLILTEVIAEGNEEQQVEAQTMLSEI